MPHLRGGLRHPGVVEQRGLDLPELDTQTAELDLEVGAAEVLEIAAAVVAPAHEVARAVQTFTLAEGRGDETLGGQIGAADVTARHLHAREIQLSHDTGGNRRQRESST